MDLTGHRYGRLLVIGPKSIVNKHAMWMCRCDCGTEKPVALSALRQGLTVSCGCHRDEVTVARSTTHGLTKVPEYRVWTLMRQRCENPKFPAYRDYGGRGISVCERWQEFENFYADMGSRPTPDHEIDRIDNDGPYAPVNCRWTTRTEQCNNKRNNRRLTHDGRTMTAAEWSRELGISQNLIANRLHKGWSVERALTTS
jgi:hypothetical protein